MIAKKWENLLRQGRTGKSISKGMLDFLAKLIQYSNFISLFGIDYLGIKNQMKITNCWKDIQDILM